MYKCVYYSCSESNVCASADERHVRPERLHRVAIFFGILGRHCL